MCTICVCQKHMYTHRQLSVVLLTIKWWGGAVLTIKWWGGVVLTVKWWGGVNNQVVWWGGVNNQGGGVNSQVVVVLRVKLC